MGVAAGLDWNGFCEHRLPFRAIYLGCLGHTEFQKQNDKTKSHCTENKTEMEEQAHTSGIISISTYKCLGRVALLNTAEYRSKHTLIAHNPVY